MTATPVSRTSQQPAGFTLTPESKRVFIGLMLGMLVAAGSQTIVSPAMPIIVAELGGMSYYSWLATSAMLASAVIVPVVGKLSDLYGRRVFYIWGLVLFMLGTVLAGLAGNFWWLVGARVIQGLGMGTLMPLSQVIIGDIIPPRQRGKYQGIMGAVFGITSVAGPLAGGFITDHWGWRWLFYVTLPIGIAALVFIVKNLHLPHTRREAKLDVAGISLLTVALVAILLATSWGGTTYPWGSWEVLGAYILGFVMLAIFIPVELRAKEPVMPLHLFRDGTFTAANIASFVIAMGMFGSIFYIPVYAQGVMGVNATNSGLIVMPMSLAMILVSVGVGLLITRTGRYKGFMLTGNLLMVVGFLLLVDLSYGDPIWHLRIAMVVLGLGLGTGMSTYVLVVQNKVPMRDMGVATSAVQFFRSAGGTVGIAILGTIMTSRMGPAIAGHLPPGADAGAIGGMDASSVLDPDKLAHLPGPIVDAVRMGMSDALHQVFVVATPIVLIAFLATLFIKKLPLRDTLHEPAGQQVEEVLSEDAAQDAEDAEDAEDAAGAAAVMDAAVAGGTADTRDTRDIGDTAHAVDAVDSVDAADTVDTGDAAKADLLERGVLVDRAE
ncbi:MDR family MFS transporter [Pseudactinotalea sp. HY160]|uniref:MDR family MFS transporter n=1 Tax=Pseudactinotalea sp. HY160 TaxID=2654490 RepID=UPI00351BC0AC